MKSGCYPSTGEDQEFKVILRDLKNLDQSGLYEYYLSPLIKKVFICLVNCFLLCFVLVTETLTKNHTVQNGRLRDQAATDVCSSK